LRECAAPRGPAEYTAVWAAPGGKCSQYGGTHHAGHSHGHEHDSSSSVFSGNAKHYKSALRLKVFE